MTDQTDGVVFECEDCGCEVHRAFTLAANDQHLCLECQWLRGIEDPKEREALRAVLQPNPRRRTDG